MVKKSPRRDLDDYEPGDQGWDHSDLVNDYDEHAIERGVKSDRPSSGDYDNELYLATDENILYQWDDGNSQWVIRGGKGSSSQGLDSLHADSLATDDADINRRFVLSNDDYRPFQPRAFEASGTMQLQPHPSASQPVLTGSDVTDVASGTGVADPFIVHDGSQFHMFFEILPDSGTTSIGHATSQSGFEWTYDQEVLADGQATAYPHVFKWDGTWYMVPNSGGNSGEMHIYEATSFPTSWSQVETAISSAGSDPTPFYFNDRWYVISGYSNQTDEVRLYYGDGSRSLTGQSWTEHPSSPIYGSGNSDGVKGPGGRPIVLDDRVHFVMQNRDSNVQGTETGTKLVTITDLTTSSFSASVSSDPLTERPRDDDNDQWNDNQMHHVDAMMPFLGGPDIVVVDAQAASSTDWAIGIYTTAAKPRTMATLRRTGSTTGVSSSSSWTGMFLDTRGPTMTYESTDSFDLLNSGKFVAPSGGWYRLSGQVTFNVAMSSFSAHTVQARIQNTTQSATIVHNQETVAVNNTEVSVPLPVREIRLDDGDNVELGARQDSGESHDLVQGQAKTYLQVRKVW